MFDYKRTIAVIDNLRRNRNTTSIRSALLESRIALEATAYDRLMVSRSYIGSEDLKRWKPRAVIDFLAAEVDARIRQTFTLSIAENKPGTKPTTADEYKLLDWKELGTQSELDVLALNKLWHRTSNFLHFDSSDRSEPQWLEAADRCLDDVIRFLEKVAEGNLVSTMVFRSAMFSCRCGTEIRRNADLLRNGHIIRCPNPECYETYNCATIGDSFSFEARGTSFECPGCQGTSWIPGGYIDPLRFDQRLYWKCACGQVGYLRSTLRNLIPGGNRPETTG